MTVAAAVIFGIWWAAMTLVSIALLIKILITAPVMEDDHEEF